MRLHGKIAAVTGASSGIGFAIAERFAREGAYVYMAARRQTELDEAVGRITGRVTGVPCDVTRLADLDGLFARVRAEQGRLDVLAANAGIGELVALADIDEEHVDRTFAVNVKGTLFTVQKALPLIGPGGSIILTGSTAATTGASGFSVYGASKAAIRSFARNWILDLKGSGIRVNVLVPGATDTPGLSGLVPATETAGFYAALASQVPLNRVGHADEIAAAALFLASDESSFVTGAELYVDGGVAQV